MKKIINKTIFVFAGIILFISCSKDFLDQKPTSSITDLTYYKNPAQLETVLISSYAAMRWWFDVSLWAIGDVGSDDADCGSLTTDQPDLYNISYSRQNASNGWIQGFWQTSYLVIARCNAVIDRSTSTKGDQAEIEKIVNQAKFLRALCYYQLVALYGEVPLVNKFLYPDQLNLKRAAVADIWAQIEADLKDATNLPTVSEWNESGRVTSGAAYSMLGKVYLTERKYAEANAAFSKVVRSNEYQLVPDYGYIFRHEGENCQESVFEIQNKNGIEGGGNMGTYNVIFRLPRDPGEGWGFDCPSADLLNEYEKGDPRIIYTFMFPGDVFPTINGETYTVVNELSPTGYNDRKAWIPWSERTGVQWYDWDMNVRYMRYAEVLLLYAESLNEVNKADSACMLVNMVRARARSTPASDPQRISCAHPLSYTGTLLPDITTTNQAQLRQAIWHEQRVELAIEGNRRYTLLRTGQFKQRMEESKSYAGVTVEPFELLFPIPHTEIELSNYVLTQNPGY
jgi:starch-binding outer membrane protein, SusD/RagB family